MTDRLDRFQQRHSWAGFPLAVIYKYADDQGYYLAALITYYGFVSLFPLLLLLYSVLGFVLQGHPQVQEQLFHSALSQFPVIGDQIKEQGLKGSGMAIVVGVIGLVYGGSGVAQALQNAMNTVWAVARNRRPNPVLSRIRSLLLIVLVGGPLVGTTVLSGVGSSAGSFGASAGVGVRVLAIAASVVLNVVIFVAGFRVATASRLGTRESVPGAVTAAIVWQLLQIFGSAYVARIVKHATATTSIFAFVLGTVAWIYIEAVTVVICSEINVVRARRLYPRSLLTPFTDDVNLTRADQEAYEGYATAQRNKGFEQVDVTFDHDGQNASARRRRGEPE